ncbi:NUDIX domain-containing protein [Halomonas sp. DQ26W]|uniref:NUDIX hydrolase n=1 Tax=Halomonas sp. DQ26W TaxID=2282311 RepID=UPI000DF81D99|nr:NUDIX hydrolase [Halomonas sp. DQ26W]RDB43349.1 NUDIX domain-containing protein [Halomonas sp. DQ26W]
MTMPRRRAVITPRVAVSAALLHVGRVLLVRRRYSPNAGMLALPGGRIKPGESLMAAATRELWEETAIEAEPLHVLTAVEDWQHDADGRLLSHYVIVVVRCRWLGGTGVAGNDASEIHWLDAGEVSDDATICTSTRKIANQLLVG